MTCVYECYMVGRPWIAENPECPVHGVEGQSKARAKEWLDEAMLEVLCRVWNRELSADEGLYAIQLLSE